MEMIITKGKKPDLSIEDPRLLDQLNAMEPEDLLRWALDHHGPRAGIITSFQDTGTVILDLAHRVAPGLRVITIDTLRLPSETYTLIDEIEERYSIEVERFQPEPDGLKRMIDSHGLYLFFDSKAKQEHCCNIRKVEPNIRALGTLDVWITGLRRDQSDAREQVPKASIAQVVWGSILKIAPLADWDFNQVRDYIKANGLPYNKLYDQGYTSIGCTICSTPTKTWEDKRAGRWRWFNNLDGDDKECGIHTHGGGI